MSFEVKHNGRTYEWEDGVWFDTTKNMVAPESIRSELNAGLISQLVQPSFISHYEEQGKRHVLFNFLSDRMGVSLAKLSTIGFFDEVMATSPEVALENLFSSDSTPSGLSFVNCKRLRDRFFSGKPTVSFQMPVKLLGSGPFEQEDMKSFLKKCKVPMWKRNTPVNALILGRTGWDRDKVAELIEEAEGSVLQIYSQEMLVSILAGQPDPFQTWPLKERLWDLYPFRSGHPGLEYVSNGWAGWIKGAGYSSAVSWGNSTADFSQVEQSPLSVMGYRAGVSGLEEDSRRQILRSAFEQPLPFVESPAYMEGWGKPSSADRLKRIAQHLANVIESHSNLTNHHVAVSDWRNDLEWLKSTFYRGIYTFYWPQV